jgi:hypothetical protein
MIDVLIYFIIGTYFHFYYNLLNTNNFDQPINNKMPPYIVTIVIWPYIIIKEVAEYIKKQNKNEQ